MAEHRLTRTGDAPLEFAGEPIAEEAGKWQAGKERNRWVDLRLYRTAAGRYVVERVYRTLWQGESDREEAIILGPDVREAVAELRAWDPAELGIGYPPGEQWAERQGRLLDELRSLYRLRLSAILESLPGAAERIE